MARKLFELHLRAQQRGETMNAEEKAIATVLSKYEDALNQSDTAAVMNLYAPDGVFRAITLTVKFAIAEIKQVGSDWAFARTNSAGTVKVNATGQSSPEANQELFVFQKVGNDWKIARYCFSTTNPPRA